MIPGSEPVAFTVQQPKSQWPLLVGLFFLVTVPLLATDYLLVKVKHQIGAQGTRETYSLRSKCRDDALQLYRTGGYDKLGAQPVVHFGAQSLRCYLQLDRDGGPSGLRLTVIDAESGEILIRDQPYRQAVTNTRFAEVMGDSAE